MILALSRMLRSAVMMSPLPWATFNAENKSGFHDLYEEKADDDENDGDDDEVAFALTVDVAVEFWSTCPVGLLTRCSSGGLNAGNL